MKPAPMTPADADLTMFKDMPFEFARFARSDLVAFSSAEGIVAALFLWGVSWHQRPAGSLTNDDRSLSAAAGYGRAIDAWLAVKSDALRGWVECSDGRLYHPVVAEKVKESWNSRVKHLHSNYREAVRAYNRRNPSDEREPMHLEQWDKSGRPSGVREEGAQSKQPDLPLPDPENVRRTPDKSPADSGGESEGEGKGREGKGYNKESTPSNPAPPARVPAREGSDDADDDSTWDLLGITNRIARAGAISLHKTTIRADAMDLVKDWLSRGIDPVTTIIPAVEQARINSSHKTFTSLTFYAPYVEAVVAKAGGTTAQQAADWPPARRKAYTDAMAQGEAKGIPSIRVRTPALAPPYYPNGPFKPG